MSYLDEAEKYRRSLDLLTRRVDAAEREHDEAKKEIERLRGLLGEACGTLAEIRTYALDHMRDASAMSRASIATMADTAMDRIAKAGGVEP